MRASGGSIGDVLALLLAPYAELALLPYIGGLACPPLLWYVLTLPWYMPPLSG